MSPDFAPQTTHLKDVLRSLRYTLRRGRDTVKETAPRRLPAPASEIALSALGEIEVLARNVDQLACKLAHSVLEDSAKLKSFREVIASSRPQYEFSVAFYETMKLVLSHLGAKRTLINQSAALRAFVRTAASQDVYQLAAQLTLHLADEGLITVDQLEDRSPVARPEIIVVAVFAGMLSLLAESDDAGREVMIAAATDIAVALQEKIMDLYREKDGPALAALFQRCAGHV
ncbi:MULTISPECIES: hypothetical protein [Rhizobium]|uniref:Ribosomal protein L16 Arg81 hydroxylase n=2 Tax=Rhizobium TaxID=379 RepID=A0A7W6BLL3_9HYPH|nr:MULTISPECIES: hypothetical protein [Rhizobium]MBB3919531.1 ribosomal protein L16 Arg81 hydroxylase [Rhizobium fabae]PDT04473.1 hypothetical protein CO666_11525 [Rhizobium chutanense]